jgi:hypothetical protein
VRAVLVLYVARPTSGRLAPGDDAIEARWFPIGRPPRPIAFAAHTQALEEFAERMKAAGALAVAPTSTAAAARNGAASPRVKVLKRPRPARAARSRSTRG